MKLPPKPSGPQPQQPPKPPQPPPQQSRPQALLHSHNCPIAAAARNSCAHTPDPKTSDCAICQVYTHDEASREGWLSPLCICELHNPRPRLDTPAGRHRLDDAVRKSGAKELVTLSWARGTIRSLAQIIDANLERVLQARVSGRSAITEDDVSVINGATDLMTRIMPCMVGTLGDFWIDEDDIFIQVPPERRGPQEGPCDLEADENQRRQAMEACQALVDFERRVSRDLRFIRSEQAGDQDSFYKENPEIWAVDQARIHEEYLQEKYGEAERAAMTSMLKQQLLRPDGVKEHVQQQQRAGPLVVNGSTPYLATATPPAPVTTTTRERPQDPRPQPKVQVPAAQEVPAAQQQPNVKATRLPLVEPEEQQRARPLAVSSPAPKSTATRVLSATQALQEAEAHVMARQEPQQEPQQQPASPRAVDGSPPGPTTSQQPTAPGVTRREQQQQGGQLGANTQPCRWPAIGYPRNPSYGQYGAGPYSGPSRGPPPYTSFKKCPGPYPATMRPVPFTRPVQISPRPSAVPFRGPSAGPPDKPWRPWDLSPPRTPAPPPRAQPGPPRPEAHSEPSLESRRKFLERALDEATAQLDSIADKIEESQRRRWPYPGPPDAAQQKVEGDAVSELCSISDEIGYAEQDLRWPEPGPPHEEAQLKLQQDALSRADARVTSINERMEKLEQGLRECELFKVPEKEHDGRDCPPAHHAAEGRPSSVNPLHEDTARFSIAAAAELREARVERKRQRQIQPVEATAEPSTSPEASGDDVAVKGADDHAQPSSTSTVQDAMTNCYSIAAAKLRQAMAEQQKQEQESVVPAAAAAALNTTSEANDDDDVTTKGADTDAHEPRWGMKETKKQPILGERQTPWSTHPLSTWDKTPAPVNTDEVEQEADDAVSVAAEPSTTALGTPDVKAYDVVTKEDAAADAQQPEDKDKGKGKETEKGNQDGGQAEEGNGDGDQAEEEEPPVYYFVPYPPGTKPEPWMRSRLKLWRVKGTAGSPPEMAWREVKFEDMQSLLSRESDPPSRPVSPDARSGSENGWMDVVMDGDKKDGEESAGESIDF